VDAALALDRLDDQRGNVAVEAGFECARIVERNEGEAGGQRAETLVVAQFDVAASAPSVRP